MSAVLQCEPVIVRPMQEDDLANVGRIERASYDFPWSTGIFSDCLRVGYSCWVLDAGSEGLCGYGIMSVAVEEGHVLNLCVAPEARKRGLARALLGHLLRTAVDHGAVTTYLEVRPTNAAAIALYNGVGFRHVGTRRDYYPAQTGREDAYIFSRSLIDGTAAFNDTEPLALSR